MTIFDWLNEITSSKRSWDGFTDADKESFNPYMVSRFISMKREYIDIVNIAQNYMNFIVACFQKANHFFVMLNQIKQLIRNR
jgi:hypothetical protein